MPEVALITGAGPAGLLAALLAWQRGLDTWVIDVVTGGPKPQLIADLGATYSATRASGHYDQAAGALARADPTWLARLLTRQVSMAEWPAALAKQPDDIKVTVTLDDGYA